MEYARSCNIGDEIQTAAVAQHLGPTAGYVDRDELQSWCGETSAVVMQGWFTKDPATFPPSPAVLPVYVGFHLGEHVRHVLDRPAVAEALRHHGPVGCRDTRTAELLHAADIDAFVSGCLTTTFPRRTEEPEDGKVFLVDTHGVALPEDLRAPDSIRVTHQGAPWWSEEAKRRVALDVLSTYRDHARLVVTTRLHCALPCVAMGIPVVFVGDMSDPRLGPIEGLASVISFPDELRSDTQPNRLRRRAYWRQEMQHGNWDGFAADIESQKHTRVGLLATGLRAVGAHHAADHAERTRCMA
jgi:hypothetical protein